MARNRIACCVLLFSLLESCLAYYAMNIEAGETECVRFYTSTGVGNSNVLVNFEVLEDDLDEEDIDGPVRVMVTQHAKKEPLWKIEGMGGRTSFESNGLHSLCITNIMEDEDDEVDVGFNIRVHSLRRTEDAEEDPGPDDELTASLFNGVDGLMEVMHVLLDHQGYMRQRESVHRSTSEATFSRVVRWTIIQVLVVLGVASGQIYYLKKFFETKRYL